MTTETRPSTASESSGVQVVSRASRLLRALSEVGRPVSFSELASHTGLARATVHRLVNALADEDLVSIEDGHVSLGIEIYRMAAATQNAISGQMRPHLERLHDSTGETVELVLLRGDALDVVEQIVSPHALRVVRSADFAVPLHCSAAGKALLSRLSPTARDGLLRGADHSCPLHPHVSRAALNSSLDLIRSRGVAVDAGEHAVGIVSLAAAVDVGTESPAVLTVLVPEARYTDRLLETLLKASTLAETRSPALGG
jgi:IclR family acetate operon transcriptional repressor